MCHFTIGEPVTLDLLGDFQDALRHRESFPGPYLAGLQAAFRNRNAKVSGALAHGTYVVVNHGPCI